MTPTIIHKRKSPNPTHSVEHGGRCIGFVCRRARVAAGGNGKDRALFWTATPDPNASYPDSGGLGTRFPTRHAATAALRAFDKAYPPERIARLAFTWGMPTYRGRWKCVQQFMLTFRKQRGF